MLRFLLLGFVIVLERHLVLLLNSSSIFVHFRNSVELLVSVHLGESRVNLDLLQLLGCDDKARV